MKKVKTKKISYLKETLQNLTEMQQLQVRGGDGPDTTRPAPVVKTTQRR